MGAGKSKPSLKPEELADLRQQTFFSDQEIQEWYKGFIRDCPSGKIDATEFKIMYQNIFPEGDPSAFSDHVFRMFDNDNSGFIDFREFITAISVTSKGNAEQKLRWAFRLYDLDASGYISKREMLTIVKSIFSMMGPDLQLPEDENTPEKRTAKIFNQLDKNADDQVSLEEFIEGALNDPAIMQMLQCDPSVSSKRKKSLPKVRIDSAGDEGGGSGCGRLRRHTSEPCSGDEREEFEMQEDIVRSRERLAGGNSLDIPEDHKPAAPRRSNSFRLLADAFSERIFRKSRSPQPPSSPVPGNSPTPSSPLPPNKGEGPLGPQ